MLGKHEYEALVVGAGPVGLFAALRLAQRGVRVEIIDSQWRPAARSYALALHPDSLALLGRAEVVDDLLAHGHRVDRVAFYDGAERRAELSLADTGGPFPFVLVLPQQTLEEVLGLRLASHGVKVRWNHRLARLEDDERGADVAVETLGKDSVGYSVATNAWAVIKTRSSRARFVIGADGYHSAVRRALGIAFDKVGPRQLYGVFELDADADDADEVRVVLGDDTGDVLWPLGHGRWRWSFELADDWEFTPRSRAKRRLSIDLGDDAFPYLDATRLDELVAARAPFFDAAVGDVGWSVAVRFERRLAARFGRGHVQLAGDAAHLAAPIGVQSMNAGLREADELARTMADLVHQGGDHRVLERYDDRNRARWRLLQGLDPGVVATAATDPWVRERAQRLLSCVPATGATLAPLLAQLGLELSSSRAVATNLV